MLLNTACVQAVVVLAVVDVVVVAVTVVAVVLVAVVLVVYATLATQLVARAENRGSNCKKPVPYAKQDSANLSNSQQAVCGIAAQKVSQYSFSSCAFKLDAKSEVLSEHVRFFVSDPHELVSFLEHAQERNSRWSQSKQQKGVLFPAVDAAAHTETNSRCHEDLRQTRATQPCVGATQKKTKLSRKDAGGEPYIVVVVVLNASGLIMLTSFITFPASLLAQLAPSSAALVYT